MNKHMHSECIIAWANGAKVQYKNFGRGPWRDAPSPSWLEECEYRIKPEPIKTVGYRRYIFKDLTGTYRVAVVSSLVSPDAIARDEQADWFIKWIDLEWQYEEIEL